MTTLDRIYKNLTNLRPEMLRSGWERIQYSTARLLYNRSIAKIETTAPIHTRSDGVVVVSMIGTTVVRSYLVAIKSFLHHLGRGRVVILDDGTLKKADKELLDHQLGRPQILPISKIQTDPCPSGACWERLLCILDLRENDYVIQLDSDTVTLGPVVEINEAIAANRSFTLAGGDLEAEVGVMSLSDVAPKFYPDGLSDLHFNLFGRHQIQAKIESLMASLPLPPDCRYVRGCAGFAGFSKGGAGRLAANDFSLIAQAAVGKDRWAEWGSEQVASSYIIANDTNPLILPYQRYSNYFGENWGNDMRFVHFVGYSRFSTDAYRTSSLRAIANL